MAKEEEEDIFVIFMIFHFLFLLVVWITKGGKWNMTKNETS